MENGLTSEQAGRRLRKHGQNVFSRKRQVSAAAILWSQFKSPLIIILILAAGVSGFILGQAVDAAMIGLAVIVNTALGFIQEFRAEKALEAISKLLSPQAKVIRDGKRQLVDAADLVPGDVVVLEIGRIVPADGYLIEADGMTVNEAILTGESLPVGKLREEGRRKKEEGQTSLVFMGTSIASGIGKMVVTKTGDKTRMGQIASSVGIGKKQKTPLQKEVNKLGRMMGLTALAIAGVIIFVGIAVHKPLSEMLILAVALAVAAIPEGLAVSLTAILAVGMRRLLKRHALVHKLAAAETLGAVTTICIDKTGTLTEGKMRVVGAEGIGSQVHRLMVAAVLCNDLRDPLEIAMDRWAREQLGEETQKIITAYRRLDEIPFSPSYKYIATLHRTEMTNDELRMTNDIQHSAFNIQHSKLLFVSGAPEVILEKSEMSVQDREKWNKKFQDYAGKGLRIVAFGYKEISNKYSKISQGDLNNFQWLGLVIFEDPVRAGAGEALAEAQALGLTVKVITGDYLETTIAVIDKLKLSQKSLRATEGSVAISPLKSDCHVAGAPRNDKEDLRYDDIEIFARVTPEEKLKIVKDLQAKGEVVAMMGDGVNDAPALSAADIGIVVSSASDVSKQSADMVLLDDNFSTILMAIKQGRAMLDAFRRVLAYLVSDSFAEIILIILALVLSIPLPITALMILWVNLISDGLPGLALTVIHDNGEGMSIKRLLDRKMYILVGAVSMVKGFLGILGFLVVLRLTANLHLAQSTVLAILTVGSILSAFAFGGMKLLANKFLIAAAAAGLGLLVIVLEVPFFQVVFGTAGLGIMEWTMALVAGGMVAGVVKIINLHQCAPITQISTNATNKC